MFEAILAWITLKLTASPGCFKFPALNTWEPILHRAHPLSGDLFNYKMIDTINTAISWGLFVLIWLVQIIIYPGFHRIPTAEFVEYHRWYAYRISIIVLPLMLCEIVALLGWWWYGADRTAAYVATLAVSSVWLSTFGLQVPIHKRLQYGKDDALIRRLVATNWIRTAAWSIKALVVTALV